MASGRRFGHPLSQRESRAVRDVMYRWVKTDPRLPDCALLNGRSWLGANLTPQQFLHFAHNVRRFFRRVNQPWRGIWND